MITFDQIIPILRDTFYLHKEVISQIDTLIVNRDLNGKVRLIIPSDIKNNPDLLSKLEEISSVLSGKLAPHTFSEDRILLFEDNITEVLSDDQQFKLEDFNNVVVIDRLASEGCWARIASESKGSPRVVFFSIKGGVGRSTAMATSAWWLAQSGRRVLVVDLDLESPGLSSGLLPKERRPEYGITDWLVEDLVDNGDTVFEEMIAISELAHDGEIYVVPAHGATPGDYIAKLGRVSMPKISAEGERETWSQRLDRLLSKLEQRFEPDIILIDSRSGVDEIASSCVTDLGANLVLLFAIDGEQTWSGYRMLFQFWHQAGVARKIRERLQLVGAMIPEVGASDYFSNLKEHSWDLFSETLYDEIPPGEVTNDHWNFDDNDEEAPHYPWPIKWHRGFAALTSLHSRLTEVDSAEVESIFGTFLKGLERSTALPEVKDE